MKFFYLFSFLMMTTAVLAQDPEQWQSLDFSVPENYKSNEPTVLQCANFVLGMPAEAGNPARQSAMGVLAKWITGTPDYTFVIDESIARLMEKNEAILSIYMASLAQTVLENNDLAGKESALKLEAFNRLLDYCEEPTNKVPMSKELKKAISAREKGKLLKYLEG